MQRHEPVKAVMTEDPVTVGPDTPFKDIAELLAERSAMSPNAQTCSVYCGAPQSCLAACRDEWHAPSLSPTDVQRSHFTRSISHQSEKARDDWVVSDSGAGVCSAARCWQRAW